MWSILASNHCLSKVFCRKFTDQKQTEGHQNALIYNNVENNLATWVR